jgi:hypothetical protein
VQFSVLVTETLSESLDHHGVMEQPNLDSLPRAYRIGLRLHGLGADNEFIAECLEINPDGVPTLLEVGRHKLERLAGGPESAHPATDP